MRVFKTLLTTLFAFLLYPTDILAQSQIELPNNVIVSKQVSELNPNFLLQLVQSNFQLISDTFLDPSNSFNVIVDPQQRIDFLQTVTSSLNDITTSLSTIITQFGINIDTGFISSINNEVNNLMNLVSIRASEYILPLNISTFEINDNFIINRFDQNKININTLNNFVIQVPIILQQLNHSLYDLSTQIDTTESYIVSDILATYNVLLLKLSDLQNNAIATSVDIISKINTEVCSFVADCDLYCGVWDKNLQLWIKYPSRIYDMHQVVCTIPMNSNNIVYSTISTSEFLPIGVFNREVDSSSSLSTGFVVFIGITCFIFMLMFAYAVKKYYIRKKYGFINNPENLANYNSIDV
jgi:hypothetical protein